jgi:hypothetical protein
MTYTEPLMLVVVVWVLVGILLRRKWLAFSGVVGLVLITLPAAEWVFSRPLEGTYPVRPFVQPPDVEAIVVFSGGVEPPIYERPYAEANRDTYERCRYAAWIYRQSQVPVLACGGGPRQGKHPPFSAAMREILIQNGVAEDSIWTEDKSTTKIQLDGNYHGTWPNMVNKWVGCWKEITGPVTEEKEGTVNYHVYDFKRSQKSAPSVVQGSRVPEPKLPRMIRLKLNAQT